MPCNPSDNTLSPGYVPGLPIPGFGIPVSPVQLPVPNFKFPDAFPADLLDMINTLSIQWPGGTLLPQVDNTANTLLKYLSNLFTQIAPFLSLYNLFMALLNMVQCIIDVLCAIPNPWKLAKAFRRLIKNCLLPFVNLFPPAALIAMIISLLLLLLALIEYLIAKILQIIADMIENFKLLQRGTTLKDSESTKAVTFKIASLFCIIENLLAIFGSLGAIFAIINSLAQIGGPKLCSKSSGSDCCDDDTCPDFISNNPNGISATTGKLIYYKQINKNNVNDFSRNESWQFVNSDLNAEYKFRNITDETEGGFDFWPDQMYFTASSKKKTTPYTVDIRLKNVDTTKLWFNTETPIRDIIIKGTVVTIRPYNYIYTYNNSISTENTTGTLQLVGGKAYEVDGTPIIINGTQATLTSFIHNEANNSYAVTSDDRLEYDAEFTLNINQEALMYYQLITLGCLSQIRQEADVFNNTIISDPIIAQIPDIIPDLDGTLKCAKEALTKVRKNITLDTIDTFKNEIVQCLESLKDTTLSSVCEAIQQSVDVFNTTGEIDTTIQFTARPIKVKVVLYDKNNNLISYKIPDSCQTNIASNITGDVTLGELSTFTYNSEDAAYYAEITSSIEGKGELSLKWKGNYFSTINNREDVDADTTVTEDLWKYTFIGTNGDGSIRRDETDVSISMVV